MKATRKSPAESVSIIPRGRGFQDLFKGMDEWTDQIALRAYELFQQHGVSDGHALDDWLTAEREFLKPVLLDVKEADGQFVLQAEVPGFEAKDLHVQVDGGRLVIAGNTDGEAEKQQGNTVYNERKAQQIYRMINLPIPILAEKAQAQLKNGVLKLKLPKATQTKKVKGV